MYLRKILVRQLLALYPALWRKEYGEEMRSMLLAQPLTASVIVDVFLNGLRQNFRQPDPWKIAALILICWRTFWILLPSVFQLSAAAWVLFVQIDRGFFLLVALATGCWTVISEGDIERGAYAGWWAALAGHLVPKTAMLLAFFLAATKTIPGWALATIDHLPDQGSWRNEFRGNLLPMALATWCGALLGYLIRRRRASAPLNRA